MVLSKWEQEKCQFFLNNGEGKSISIPELLSPGIYGAVPDKQIVFSQEITLFFNNKKIKMELHCLK